MIVCTGSRAFDDMRTASQRIRERLERLPEGTVVYQGGARGADRIVRSHCRDLGLDCRTLNAIWDLHLNCRCSDKTPGTTCRYAGVRRNREMLSLEPTLVIAFWDGMSPGTKSCIDDAAVRDIPEILLL